MVKKLKLNQFDNFSFFLFGFHEYFVRFSQIFINFLFGFPNF
jgi:hypothetical protein